jgi:hypothetical protein
MRIDHEFNHHCPTSVELLPHVLRDDGVSYGDYVEQLAYLLFLKRASEGKLVPQDPSDEAASVLLKRIKARRRGGRGRGRVGREVGDRNAHDSWSCSPRRGGVTPPLQAEKHGRNSPRRGGVIPPLDQSHAL